MLSIPVLAQNYSGKVVYRQKMEVPALKDKHSMEAELFKDAAERTEVFKYNLIFNEEESLFQVEDFLNNDASNSLENMALRISGGKGVFYKNTSSINTLHQRDSFGEIILLELPGTRYVWELTSETKKIGKFTVYKAKTTVFHKAPRAHLKDKTVHIEAWFAPDIPVCFGPKDINGLPGLVLQAKIGNVNFTATDVNIEKNPEEALVITTPEGKQMNLEELDARARRIAAKDLLD